MVLINNVESPTIAAVLPTLDEAYSIRETIERLKQQKVNRIIVIDGSSKDRTPEIAESCGADVFKGDGKGKGHDFKLFQRHIQENPIGCDYVVMFDPDGSYRPDIRKLIEPLKYNNNAVVMGVRKLEPGSMKSFNKIANYFLLQMIGISYPNSNIKDGSTGCWALHEKDIAEMPLSAEGFDMEVNMIDIFNRKGYRFIPVETVYEPRAENSISKLKPLKSIKIPLQLLRYRLAGNSKS